MYILNEKNYIRDVISSGEKPEDITNGYLIKLIAKYYFDKDEDVYNLIDKVKQKMLEFNIEGYQEYKYAKKIHDICEELYESEADSIFKELEYIPIYEKELEVVESLPSDREKKFMFTLYAIARYMNCDGWVNKKDLKGLYEIFKLANVSLSADKKNDLLHNLYINGYITFAKSIDNMNIHIELGDENDDIVYKITDFENLGNQYIGNFKKGYKQCKTCGKKIATPNNGRPKLYCDKCAKEINKNKTKERMKTLRNA